MRIEIVDEARDFAESFGPHHVIKVQVIEKDGRKDLILVDGDYTCVLVDVQGWAEYLTDLL